MRECLYCGKRVDNGEWVEGWLQPFTRDGYIGMSDRLCIINGIEAKDIYEVFPKTVSEYTGLIDKNGKKIFEGHICTDGENIYEIIFDKYQFSVKVIKTPLYFIKKGDIFPLWQFDNCKRNGYRQLEIVGNIHDNPELLERK